MKLSTRQLEIVKLACTGMIDKQIAAVLGVATTTVKKHRSLAMRRVGAKSLVQLGVWAARNLEVA